MPETAIVLVCVECGAESDERARGWQAHLTDDEHEPQAVAIYCGDCGEREFGHG